MSRIIPFTIWFSLIGSLFLLLLFGLRQPPDGYPIQEPFTLVSPEHGTYKGYVPFTFSDYSIPTSQQVSLSWNINITDTYENPSILIERPVHHIRVFWDGKRISTPSNAIHGQGRMLVLNTIPKDMYTKGTHTLAIEVQGENNEAGILERIWIGNLQEFLSYIQRRVAAGIFLTAVLLFATLFNVIRFLLYPSKKHLLAYGLFFFSLMLVTLSGVDLWYIFFSSLNWQLRTKILSIILSFASSTLILGHITILSTVLSYRIFTGFACLSILPLLPFISFPLLQNIRYGIYILSPLYMIFTMVLIVYSIVQKNTKSIPFLGFGGLLIIGGILDILAIFGYSQLPPSVPVFSALFAIGVTIYLSLEDAQFAVRYEQMSLHAQDPILVVDTQGIILESNPVAQKNFKMTSRQNLYAICTSRESLLLHLEHPKQNQRAEITIRNNQEDIIFESVIASLHSDMHLLVLRDITQRKFMEKKILKSAKLETVGLISSGLAHNFNNMLTAFMGHLALLRSHVPDQERHRIDTLDHLVMNSSSSIHRILTLVRGGMGTKYPHTINSIAQQGVELAQGLLSKSITLHTNFCSENPKASLSATEIHQVIINLFINAKDALKNKGEIWIETYDDNKHVCIAIEDSGTGVPKDIQEQIFDSFFTTKDQYGTGIGLAVCKRVVEEHKGTISLEPSQHQQGARFVLRLPKALDDAPTQIIPTREKRILLVEDEWFILEIISEILTNAGWSVTAVRNAQEARNVWNPHQFRVLMTDVVMPGESGIDLAHFIQEEDPGIHIMIVSGYIPEHENELLPQWMRLPKPFQRKQLLQMLEHIPEESVPMLHIVPKESY